MDNPRQSLLDACGERSYPCPLSSSVMRKHAGQWQHAPRMRQERGMGENMMRRGHSTLWLALVVLLGINVIPRGLTAQEVSQVTDFRTHRSYTAEELGAALFPLAVPSERTRGVVLRPLPSPPGMPLKPASVIIPVLFASNSAVILPQYYADLDKLGAQLTAPHYREYRVQIEGHTDNRGSVLYNQRLSEQRAQSVHHYLVQHFAIAPERLPIKGYGFSRPIAPNTSEAGRSQNRRIEVANFAR